MNRIFGFKYKYPQKFLDGLAKNLGIKWIKSEASLIPKDEVEVKPLGKPSNRLDYFEIKYK